MNFFTTKENRPFIFFVLFLVLVLGVTSAYLPPVVLAIVGIFLIAAAVMVFLSARRALSFKGTNQRQKSEIENILGLIDDALVAHDDSFKIFFFNPSAEKLFGIKADEIIGKKLKPQDAENVSMRFLIQVLFPSLAPRMILRSEGSGYPQTIDLSFENPFRELRVMTSRIVGQNGEVLGFLKAIKNRTREVAVVKSKIEFVTVASHQLRTPINEMTWALEALSADASLGEEARELLTNAVASGVKLKRIVEDLLDISKIEEGRYGYSFSETDIIAFVGELASRALPRAEKAGLKLYFDRPKENLPEVLVDKEKLSMALSNLIDNSMRYNTEGGEIIISVRQSANGPYVEISIKDTGIGIPKEEIDKLFSKFFRAANALKYSTEGSGLGLYIAKNIAEAHGGGVSVESEINRGSTFILSLPTDPSLVPPAEPVLE